MQTQITLTELEKDVLTGINNSDYGDELGHEIWSWSIANKVATPKQIPGVVSSLTKKGLTFSGGKGDDAVIGLTELGKQICIENNLLGKFAGQYAAPAPVEEPASAPVKNPLHPELVDALNKCKADLLNSISAAALTLPAVSGLDWVVVYPEIMVTVRRPIDGEPRKYVLHNGGVEATCFSSPEAKQIAATVFNGNGEHPIHMSRERYLQLYISWAVDQIKSCDELLNSK